MEALKTPFATDSIVNTVIQRFIQRSEFGQKKVWSYFGSHRSEDSRLDSAYAGGIDGCNFIFGETQDNTGY